MVGRGAERVTAEMRPSTATPAWGSMRSVGTVAMRFPCPCCGHLVFAEQPGSYDICPVCWWEDDLVQLRWPDMGGGANHPSLIEAQHSFRRTGASDPRLLVHVRPAVASEPLDADWRPFDAGRDRLEVWVSGVDYGSTYADDLTLYYYWRRPPG